MRTFVIFLTIGLISFNSQALAEDFKNDYETCSLAAWETFKIIEYNERNVLKEKASAEVLQPKNVDLIYELIKKKGIAETRLGTLGSYFQCVKNVQASDPNISQDTPYYNCANASAFTFMTMADYKMGKTASELKTSLPPNLHKKIDLLYGHIENLSFDWTVAEATDTASTCIEDARAQSGMETEH